LLLQIMYGNYEAITEEAKVNFDWESITKINDSKNRLFDRFYSIKVILQIKKTVS